MGEGNSEAGRRPHLAHSHAHEGEIPGTVDLSAAEGDDTAYGQALYPVPAEDPNDPLQWPGWKKNIILIIVSIYSFLGNSSLTGPSVYISIYSEEFGISPAEASGLISYPNLAFGFGRVCPDESGDVTIVLITSRLASSSAFVFENWTKTSYTAVYGHGT
ncbi:unnamed protein product [Penicillium manginii]